ncbi:MAG: tRNA 2-selenouridine(34) synthase MnmH [Lautropia sp.]|nr:tRNA 2-selenouridine(34) synthase MnmH [Lautropia sp.]
MKTPQILSIDTFLDDPVERARPVIDVRTPAEYALDHLPGAVNHPVLSNRERVLVGTLQSESGAFDANVKGAALVAANIGAMLAGPLADKPRSWDPLIYCWRGGSRSWSLAMVLARVGWRVGLLEGGYRSYRQRVVADLERLASTFSFTVVAGPTGSGKTTVLKLAGCGGAQVLDLEALANHRGSVLGAVPDSPQPSQKAFDALLWQALRTFDPARPVLVESESRKIGQLHLPEPLMQRMRSSSCVKLEVPLAVRIRLLRNQYPHLEEDCEGLKDRLERLVSLHPDKRVAEWRALADAGRWEELVERLLLEHYDPAYHRSLLRNYGQSAQAPVISLPAATDEALAAAAAALLREVPLDVGA